MNQQQNKHSKPNRKRNTLPARLLTREFVGIDESGQIRCSYLSEKEIQEFLVNNPNLMVYRVDTYKINNKSLTIKSRENGILSRQDTN